MTRFVHRWPVAGFAFLLLVGSSQIAFAQDGLSADSVGQDDAEMAPDVGLQEAGVKVSEGAVFHPRVEVSTGFQTNVFFQDNADLPNGPTGAVLTRIGVGAAISSQPVKRMVAMAPGVPPPSRKVEYNVDLALTWHQYVSGDRAVQKQSDLGVGALADFKINPDAAFTFQLRDGFTRAVVPPQGPTGDNVDRDKNELLAGFVFKPGGRALEVYANYKFTLDLFERFDLAFANRQSHMATLGTKYQWLPKTQFSFEAKYGFISPNSATVSQASMPLRLWLGASTLITPRVGVVLRGGYANGFYAAGPSFSTYLALAEVRLAIGPTIRTAFGYAHDVTDSVIANYYEDHKFYARMRAQLGGRWELKLSTAFMLRAYAYGSLVTVNGVTFCGDSGCSTSDRGDAVLRFDGTVRYQASKWLALAATYTLHSDTTDAFIREPVGGDDSNGYVWQEFMATAEARF